MSDLGLFHAALHKFHRFNRWHCRDNSGSVLQNRVPTGTQEALQGLVDTVGNDPSCGSLAFFCSWLKLGPAEFTRASVTSSPSGRTLNNRWPTQACPSESNTSFLSNFSSSVTITY